MSLLATFALGVLVGAALGHARGQAQGYRRGLVDGGRLAGIVRSSWPAR